MTETADTSQIIVEAKNKDSTTAAIDDYIVMQPPLAVSVDFSFTTEIKF